VKKLPNIKSAIKRVKVNEKKNLRNRMIKTGVKTAVKKYKVSLGQDTAAAGAQLRVTTSAIDKAAAKGIIHKNSANRKKARLAKLLAKASV
jgi:small subunit ribosomal protein S20